MALILANRPCGDPIPTRNAAPPAPSTRLHELLPAITLALIGLVWLISATLAGKDVSRQGVGGQLLVIGPPALDRAGVNDIVWQAGGAVVGAGGLPNIAVAIADRPDFAKALTAAGAWLVLPSPRLLGCFSQIGAGTK